MPEPETRRVLLCGGHLHGQWITTPLHQHSILAEKPQTLHAPSAAYEGPTAGMPDRCEWRIEPMYFGLRVGGPLWIAVLSRLHGRHRDEAVLQAILQRDVAQMVLGQR